MRKFLRKAQLPTQPELSPLSIFLSPTFLPGLPPIQTHLLWGPRSPFQGREPGGGQGLAREWEEEFEARSEHSQKAGYPLALDPSEPLCVFEFSSSGSDASSTQLGSHFQRGTVPERLLHDSPFPWTGLCCPWSCCIWNPQMGQLQGRAATSHAGPSGGGRSSDAGAVPWLPLPLA